MNKNLSELGMEKSNIKIDLSKSETIQKNGVSEGKFLFRSIKGNHYNELKEINLLFFNKNVIFINKHKL